MNLFQILCALIGAVALIGIIRMRALKDERALSWIGWYRKLGEKDKKKVDSEELIDKATSILWAIAAIGIIGSLMSRITYLFLAPVSLGIILLIAFVSVPFLSEQNNRKD